MYYSIDVNFFYSKDNLVALHFKYDQARRRFVEWAQNEIAVVPDFHKRILFSGEAHFWLNGYVDKQNCRIWSEANPQVALITNFFIPELNNHDVQELWVQQGGATCHTASATIDILKDTFGDRLISRFGPVNWPPRSCDLTPLDYFLWGYVKSLVYADKPQTLDHLEDNIRRVIADIRPQMLEKVIENWSSGLDYIRASRGSPTPGIIFKIPASLFARWTFAQPSEFLQRTLPDEHTSHDQEEGGNGKESTEEFIFPQKTARPVSPTSSQAPIVTSNNFSDLEQDAEHPLPTTNQVTAEVVTPKI
ncbi:putative transposable element [Trichonephila clavipes]|nr:putative transposable element [Trichonephila clavipes]